MFQIIFM